jgi:transposase
MAHLYKKVKKGHEYYYIRETQRVYGKPTTINQIYLGTPDKIETLLGRGGFSPKEFGSVFAINELDKDLDLAGIVNEILPPKKRTKGPSLGELVFYAALNRAIAPTSKRQLAFWYETTDIQRIRPLRLESLNSQNFWNHWDRISDTDLERISGAFFKKVNGLLPAGKRQLLIEATRLQSTPRPPGILDEELQGEDFALQAQQPGVGLALVTEREWGVPLYYQTFSGNFSEGKFFERGLDDLLGRVNNLGVPVQDITLLFHQGIDSEAMVQRLNDQEGLHFVASCSPDVAPELTKISLKEFSPLPCRANLRLSDYGNDDDKVLYYETRAPFWERDRRVIITFDPRTFHKSYQDLGKRVQKVRREMSNWKQMLPEDAGEETVQACQEQLAQLCQRFKLSPDLFELSFHRENGRLNPDLQLNHRQMASNIRHFGKSILITDRGDWEAAKIYEACTKGSGLEAPRNGGKTNGQSSESGQDFRSLIHTTLMPLYHWTGSKIRVHLFVCAVALTYLGLLCQRLNSNGFSITSQEAIDELRSLRTAIYQESEGGRLRRMLEQVNDRQAAILKVLGYRVQDGKVLPQEA